MKLYLTILLTFAWINLFSIPSDTVRPPIIKSKISDLYHVLNNQLKYDEYQGLKNHLADTLILIVDRVMYQCSPDFAIDKLIATRILVRNNNYKYTLSIIEDYAYRFSYLGYNDHDKYEVHFDFYEKDDKVVFIAIVFIPVDED